MKGPEPIDEMAIGYTLAYCKSWIRSGKHIDELMLDRVINWWRGVPKERLNHPLGERTK